MSSPLVRTLFVVAIASASCSKLGRRDADEGPGQVNGGQPSRAPVRAGDRVVVESAMATFLEGVVMSVGRDRARVQLGGGGGAGGEVSERLLADLYLPASGERGSEEASSEAGTSVLHEGSYAVCHMPDGGWRGCRVESIGSLARVVDEESTTVDLPWREVLAPTAVTELNVRQRFERNAKRRAFREGAKSAGRPRLPSNWRPEMNQRVVVERDGAWVGAQVKGVRKGLVRVDCESDHRIFDAPVSDVAPEPPIEFAPTVGTYVLARPATGSHAWPVMRVEATGIASLELSDELGDRHQMAIRDVIPLDRGR
jgi:hypothetical protein